MTDVAVFGALHHDVVVDAPSLPRTDETLTGTAVDYRAGGKGCNQAIAAARMGARTAMHGRVGGDPAGDTVLDALDRAGVDREGVERSAEATGMSVAISLPGGDYGAVIVSAANLRNDGKVRWTAAPCVAVIQNEVPEAANRHFAVGLPAETYLIWNAAPARPLDGDLAGRTDLLVVNRVEAADIAGDGEPESAAKTLVKMVRGDVVVTLGGDGLILARGSEARHLPARRIEPVSTHGAGDMFVGALAARLAQGDPLEAALEFAQMAAALLVASPVAERDAVTRRAVRAALGA